MHTCLGKNLAAGVLPKAGESVEPARRHVFNFYKRAWQLHKNGYLGKKALSIIADTNGRELLFDVVHPLTRATHLHNVHDKNIPSYQADLMRFDWLSEFNPR